MNTRTIIRLVAAFASILAVLTLVAPSRARAQDPGGDFTLATPTPRLRVVFVSEIQGRSSVQGQFTSLYDPGASGVRKSAQDLVITRVPFPNDPNFETMTYRGADLTSGTVWVKAWFEQLGPKAQIKFEDTSSRTPKTYEFTKENVDHVVWPRSWLDIFLDEMELAEDAPYIEDQLDALRLFREDYATHIAEDFSDRMRDAFLDASANVLSKMRERDPTFVPVYLELGDLLRQRGLFDEELAVYMRAQTRGVPDENGAIALRLGRLLYQVLHLPEKAEQVLQSAPDLIEANQLRAKALLDLKRPKSAADVASRTFVRLYDMYLDYQSFSDSTEWDLYGVPGSSIDAEMDLARLLAAKALVMQGRLFEARDQWLVAIPPGSNVYEAAQVELAKVYLAEGEYREVTQRVLRTGNNDTPNVSQAMRDAARESDPVADPAVDVFGNTTFTPTYNPLVAEALCLVARAQMLSQRDNGTRDTVGKFCLHAMRYDPASAEPFLVMAEHARRQSAHRDRAGSWLARAATVNPRDPRIAYTRGLYAAEDRDFSTAIDQLKGALKLAPNYLDALALLGELYYRYAQSAPVKADPNAASDGSDREALLAVATGYFNNALALDPANFQLKLKLAHCYLERAQIWRLRAINYRVELAQYDKDQPLYAATMNKLRGAWASCQGALVNAETRFDLSDRPPPEVLAVYRGAPGAKTRIVVNIGENNGPGRQTKLRFAVARNEAVFEVVDLRQYTLVAEPVYFDTKEQIDAANEVRMGDALADLHTMDQNGLAVPFEIDPSIIYQARAGRGFVLYMRDLLQGEQALVDGQPYQPSADLQTAIDLFKQVRDFARSEHPAARPFRQTETFAYADACYRQIVDNAERVQWRDDFDSPVAAITGTDFGSWTLNKARDTTVAARIADGRLHLTSNVTTRGGMTRLLKAESLTMFHAAEVTLRVNPQTGAPTGLGQNWLALHVAAMPIDGTTGGIPSAAEESQIVAGIQVVIDTNGNVYYRVTDANTPVQQQFRAQPTRIDDRDWDTSAGGRMRGPTRTLRLTRVLDSQGNEFYWVIKDGEAEYRLKNLPTALTSVNMGAGAASGLHVGVVMQSNGTTMDVQLESVAVVREADPSWMQKRR